jgi:hypothetical protein
MDTENRISIEVPAELLEEVKTLINTAADKLTPFLISLTKKERKKIPKPGDYSSSFLGKTLGYATTDPRFAPQYLDVPEMKKDYKAGTDLLTVFKTLAKLYSGLDDTIMLCMSETYVASLTYYNSVKLAAKKNVAGSKVIFDDLKKRFEYTPPDEEEENTTPAQS